AGLLMIFRHSMHGHTPRWVAVTAAIATLLVSLGLVHEFRALPAPDATPKVAAAGITSEVGSFPVRPRFEFHYHWFTYPAAIVASADAQGFQFDFRFGLDGISLLMIVLTTLLTVSCV